jgi:hypothetical protein
MTLLCGATTNAEMHWRCIRPRNHPGDHLDHVPRCPLCHRLLDLTSVYGPAQPARLDDGTAILHRLCRDRLAAEQAGVAA